MSTNALLPPQPAIPDAVVPALASAVMNALLPPQPTVPNVVLPALTPAVMDALLLPPSSTLIPGDQSMCPKHMANVYAFLMETSVEGRARNWGVDWETCVNEFVCFQHLSGFPDAGEAYPAAGRPEEIRVWMKAHRVWKEVRVGEEFGGKLRAWWSLLQPASPHGANSDWAKLQKAGKNGLLLIFLGLVWWGHSSGTNAEWSATVADVTRAIRYMWMTMGPICEKGLGSGKKGLNKVGKVVSDVAGVDQLKRG